MRKIVAVCALAVLAGVVPVSAEPIPTPPCAPVDGATFVPLSGVTEGFSPPLVPAAGTDLDDAVGEPVPPIDYTDQSVVSFDYVIDLSGSTTVPDAKKGTVNVNLTWDNDSDFDMYVYDAAGNLLDGADGGLPTPVFEAATLSGVAQCTRLRVDVVNYAGLPTSAMTMKVAIPAKSLKP